MPSPETFNVFAFASALFAGAGVHLIDRYFAHRDASRDEAKALRGELRDTMADTFKKDKEILDLTRRLAISEDALRVAREEVDELRREASEVAHDLDAERQLSESLRRELVECQLEMRRKGDRSNA